MRLYRLWLALFLLPLLTLGFACELDEGDDDDDENSGDDDDDDDDPRPSFTYEPEAGPYEYIIITDNDLVEDVDELAGFKQHQGLTVLVKGLGEITDKANKIPQDIRDFLIDEYDPDLDQAVFIVGSHDTIPMVYFYLDKDHHTTTYEYTTPTDYFYGDLDTDWDEDGDGYYGEWEDDFFFDAEQWNVDSWSQETTWDKEIRVGRFPWDDSEAVLKYVDRVIRYGLREEAENNLTSLLIAGKIQVDGDAVFLMEYIYGIIDLPPFSGNIHTMYVNNDVAEGEYLLNHDNLMDFWQEEEPGFVMWASHGSPTGAYGDSVGSPFISNDDVEDLEGTLPGVIFSAGCTNAVPEEPSLGFLLVRDVAAAFIGSTRITHPGDYGEGAILIFPTAVENLLLNNVPIGLTLDLAIAYYMETLFLLGDYPAQLFLRNIFGFSLLGDPVLVYRVE